MQMKLMQGASAKEKMGNKKASMNAGPELIQKIGSGGRFPDINAGPVVRIPLY
jgi:hypothetical protein